MEFLCISSVICVNSVEPLGNDKDIHPSEEAEDQKDLWDELEAEVDGASEVNGVEALHADTK